MTNSSRRGPARFSPSLMTLEDRVVPAFFLVTSNKNDGEGSLRQAITDANGNDDFFNFVTISPAVEGPITLTGQITIEKDLILSGAGSDKTIIVLAPADGKPTETTRHFLINNDDEVLFVDMRGITLTGGFTKTPGGSIQISDEQLFLTDVIFDRNFSLKSGGAIAHTKNAFVSISQSKFLNNGASQNGGAIANVFPESASSLSITDTTFEQNQANVNGGAISFGGPGGVSITRSAFIENSAGNLGGAISTQSGSVGGITLTAVNSTFANNSANKGGGLHLNQTGSATFNNSTLTGNSAGTGGGVNIFGANIGVPMTVNFSSTVVAENFGSKADVFQDKSFGPVLVNANNSFFGSANGFVFTGASNLGLGTDLAPANPLLGPLQDNGGPSFTRLPEPTSPLLDVGLKNNLTTDQRGFVRTIGIGTDIGAAEYVNPAAAVVSFTADQPGPTNAATVTFTLTFSEQVTNLRPANFTVTQTGTVTGATVVALASDTARKVFTVTVGNYTGEGTVTPVLANAILVTAPGIVATALPFSATSSTIVDTILPVVAAFVPDTPVFTNGSTAVYRLTFSEPVVTAPVPGDFTLQLTGTISGAAVTAVTPDGADFLITIALGTGEGTLLPVLVVGSTDPALNPLAVPRPADLAIVVDRTAPAVVGVVRVGGPFSADPIVTYRLTFSEPVVGLTIANFTATATGLVGADLVDVVPVDADGAVYDLLLSTGTGDGTLFATLVSAAGITDRAGNPLPLPAPLSGEPFFVVRTPALFEIAAPTLFTNANAVTFTATFNVPIAGITAANFALTTTGGVTGVIGIPVVAGNVVSIPVTGITGEGTIRLDFVDGSTLTPAINPIPGLTEIPFTAGDTVVIDRTAPLVVSATRLDASPTNAASVRYLVTFNEPVLGVALGSFLASQVGAGAVAVLDVTPTGPTTFLVTVSTAPTTGPLTLSVVPNAGLTDRAGNALAVPFVSEAYQIQRAGPTVVAITRTGPAITTASTVSFLVTFSAPVSGVSLANFELAAAATVGGSQLLSIVPSADGLTALVTANTGLGDGNLGLNLINPSGVVDQFNQGLVGTFVGELYTLRRTGPRALEITVTPQFTTGTTAQFRITFSEPVTGVDASDFRLTSGGPVGASITSLEALPGGSVYLVNVNLGTGEGAVALDLLDDDSIRSVATGLVLGAGLAGDGGGLLGPAVTVDRTAPTQVVSLPTSQPPSSVAGTPVVFVVSFSEFVNLPAGSPASLVAVTADGITFTDVSLSGSGTTFVVTFSGVQGAGTLTLAGLNGAADGAGNAASLGNPVAVTITTPVIPPPLPIPPDAIPDQFQATQNTPLIVPAPGVLGNDSGTGLTAELIAGPPAGQGTVSLNPNGSFTFTPAAGFLGTTSFLYAARSAAGLSAPAVVTITVTATGTPLPPPGRTPLTAIGAGDGGGPVVRVFNPDGSQRRIFFAYEDAFRGGVKVAVGDVNGDGIDDIATSPGVGGGPRIRVFDGATGAVLYDFFAYDENFRGGANVALADVNGDGFADIITGAGPGGGPHVRIVSGRTGTDIGSFFAYVPEFTGGVRVAAGDLDGDGRAEIVTGAETGNAHVQVYSGAGLRLVQNFFAFDPATSTGGVNVTVGDANANGQRDLILSSGSDGRVRALDGRTGATIFEQTFPVPGGARTATEDRNADGVADFLVVAPQLGGPTGLLRRYTLPGLALVDETAPFGEDFTGGLYVG